MTNVFLVVAILQHALVYVMQKKNVKMRHVRNFVRNVSLKSKLKRMVTSWSSKSNEKIHENGEKMNRMNSQTTAGGSSKTGSQHSKENTPDEEPEQELEMGIQVPQRRQPTIQIRAKAAQIHPQRCDTGNSSIASIRSSEFHADSQDLDQVF